MHVFICCILLIGTSALQCNGASGIGTASVVATATTSNGDDSELDDFDFESDTTMMHQNGGDGIDSVGNGNGDSDYASVETSDANQLDSVVLFDDVMEDAEPDSFSEKEKRIKSALLHSTTDKRNRRIFTQILPILRSLSKQQRTTLAALISAQLSLDPGQELSFSQVNFIDCFRFC
jgi:hypothetical protein